MLVRLAVPADAAALSALRASMFAAMGQDVSGPWRSEAEVWFREAADDERVVIVVAESDGAVVACAMAELVPRPPSPGDRSRSAAHVSQVSTLPGHRRQGLANACLERLLAEAADRGAGRADLHATPDGAALYAALGFAPPAFPALRRRLDGPRSG